MVYYADEEHPRKRLKLWDKSEAATLVTGNMEDFNSETDSDYTSYWRDWVSGGVFFFVLLSFCCCLVCTCNASFSTSRKSCYKVTVALAELRSVSRSWMPKLISGYWEYSFKMLDVLQASTIYPRTLLPCLVGEPSCGLDERETFSTTLRTPLSQHCNHEQSRKACSGRFNAL